MRKLSVTVVACVLSAGAAQAQNLSISLGIRETGGSGPAFSNAGASGGIEWVNKDGQTLATDGTWQLFTFTPSTDPLSAFAGSTADGNLDTDWVSFEHIRILNSDGITAPIRLWVDDVSNTDSLGAVTEDFEGFAVGDEVIFQEPSFSGSTAGNLADGSSSLVSDSDAMSGTLANEINFQFVDGDPGRWLRLTTFNAPNVPNPALHANEADFAPTVSFYAKAVLVPEPSTFALGALGFLALWLRRRAVC